MKDKTVAILFLSVILILGVWYLIIEERKVNTNGNYKIIQTELNGMLLLNEATGQTWGFFKEEEKGEIIDGGWTPLKSPIVAQEN